MTTHECGFDITDFSKAENWQAILDELHLKLSDKRGPHDSFVWENDRLSVVTQNNPITGEYSRGKFVREPQIGFASFIGAVGDEESVERFYHLVRCKATYIKDETRYVRSFI